MSDLGHELFEKLTNEIENAEAELESLRLASSSSLSRSKIGAEAAVLVEEEALLRSEPLEGLVEDDYSQYFIAVGLIEKQIADLRNTRDMGHKTRLSSANDLALIQAEIEKQKQVIAELEEETKRTDTKEDANSEKRKELKMQQRQNNMNYKFLKQELKSFLEDNANLNKNNEESPFGYLLQSLWQNFMQHGDTDWVSIEGLDFDVEEETVEHLVDAGIIDIHAKNRDLIKLVDFTMKNMASNNPRPKLMADMTALCKNLEKKVSDLELETRAILNCNRAGGNGAADEWLQEVKGLHSEIDITLSTVVEERSNMESFLGEMNSELRRVMAETTRMQNFMAQYGYKAEELDIEAMLDWEEAIEEEPVPDVKPVPALYEEELKLLSDIAPPNASEFEETTDRLHFDIAPKSPEIIKKEGESSKKTSVVDSPSIFDIGLSKYGMSLVLGKDLAKSVTKQQAAASRSPEMIPNIAISKPRTESPRSPAIPNLTSILEESKYDSSPVLKLNTIAFPRNIDDSAVDITPGLPARKKPLSGRRAVIEDVTPELPTLASNIARENLKPQAGAAFSSLGDSPEMPEFTSNFVKALAIGGKERAQLKPSRPTPEFPELSILKSDVQNVTQTKTPDSPELTTVYKSMRNFKL